MISRPVVPFVVDQHIDDLGALWNARQVAAAAGHVALRHLARFDRRIDAHKDGCLVAGADGLRRFRELLVEPRAADLFAFTLISLEAHDPPTFEWCLALAEARPNLAPGVRSAVAWVEPSRLAGLALLKGSPFRKQLGIAACRFHTVDPGPQLTALCRDPDPGPRAEAIRTAACLGRVDLLGLVAESMRDENSECRRWAAWSSVVLGSRTRMREALNAAASDAEGGVVRRLALLLQGASITEAHKFLQTLAQDPDQKNMLIRCSGIVGDPAYMSWLADHMSQDQTARAAGEAFSTITGVDVALLDLERRPNEDFESGPNDDPDDANVDMDLDDGLPWPDPQKVQAWWAANASRFQKGSRYFMGQPVTREHCIDVLKNGYQRQRILAAHYLCLLEPGTPLFNTSAPAWRQQRLLAAM